MKRARKGTTHNGNGGSRRVLDEDLLYTRHFSSLSVRDLLDARDAYHVHLAHKANVIATAIGMYLIRTDDEDANDPSKTREAAQKRGTYEARTLANSGVMPWSWPCVLVFVSNWEKQSEMRHPEHVVPPFLYLDDGRIVPVCVILADHATVSPTAVPPSRLEIDTLSGGSPIFVRAQGQIRAGSVGCVVTDGTDFFALTSHHVAGEPDRPILASFRGVGKTVGTSAKTEPLRTRSFSDIYPTLAGRETRVNIDAGLVRLNDVAEWQPTVNGLGALGPILDFSADTASLDWIGAPVRAHGAVSGDLEGEVRALFYRYASVGGREFVTDFLIAPRSGNGAAPRAGARGANGGARTKGKRAGATLTHPGDSGTLWCLEPRADDRRPRPLALQWGGQKLAGDQSSTTFTQFALASSIAIVCRELELDVVTSWTEERPQYWGAVGHFKIAQQACFHVKDPTLKAFLQANLNNLTFSDDAKLEGATSLKADAFVPLSDVPDIVWKTNVNRVDRSVTRPTENPNHYADMDLPGADGETLFDVCGSPPQLDLGAWKDFYKSAKPPKNSRPGKSGKPAPLQQGCLPFRVWQVFSAMQGYAAEGDAKSFLCAAGIIAHYVGDACQPLHSSMHADGLDGATTGVHSTYEDNMVERYASDIATGVDDAIGSGDVELDSVASGRDAGNAVVALMARCHEALPPEDICNSYDRVHGGHKSATKTPAVLDALWADCGQGTIECIADGIRTLASIWESAFASATSKAAFEGVLNQDELRAVYSDADFLPSRHLGQFTADDLPAGAESVGPTANGAKTAVKAKRASPANKAAASAAAPAKRGSTKAPSAAARAVRASKTTRTGRAGHASTTTAVGRAGHAANGRRGPTAKANGSSRRTARHDVDET